MAKTLYEKLFDAHVVYEAENETPLLYIDRHLVHEVTSPQAFDGLRAHGRPVRQPGKTFATMDHNVSTQTKDINACGEMARIQMQELIKNCKEFGVELYDLNHPYQGIVHVMGPEQGVTLPGMTIVCGDSHAEDLFRIEIPPRLNAVNFNAFCHFFHQFESTRMQFFCVFVHEQ